MKYIFSLSLILFWTSISNQLQAQCSSTLESDSLELVNFYNALDGGNWTENTGWLTSPLEDWIGVSLWEDGCSVKKLELSYNSLSGNLPDINLPNLWVLNLIDQKLIGSLPDFSNLPDLRELRISSYDLSGSIPDFSNLPELRTLSLVNTNLSGTIPNFSNLPELRALDLYNNQLNGAIPDFPNFPFLQWLNFSNNELSGSIPDFSNTPILKSLILSGNSLSGNIPNFSKIPYLDDLNLGFVIKGIDFLDENQNISDIKANQLSGSIPDFSNLPNLKSLNLGFNNLSGSIPDFSNLPNLNSLLLGFNQLSGSIPDFSNLPKLYLLDLGVNMGIPEEDLYFSILFTLNLTIEDLANIEGNQLSGSIPDFSNLPNLNSLYVGYNNLSGYIPNFSNMPSLRFISTCPNNLLAPIPNFENCPLLDFSEIYFGCIPLATITGTVFNDENQNCQQDNGEQALPNIKITTNDSLTYTYTDANGFYEFNLDTGVYQISATPQNFLWGQNCPENPDSYTVSLPSYTSTIPNQDFGLNIEDECTLLIIDVAGSLLRRCFKNTHTISYCNEGTQSADSAYVELTLTPEIILLDASIPFIQEENIVSFDLGTLDIGECGSFALLDSVSCDAVLGSASCIEARIYPAFLCQEISPLWDGSDIIVEGECIDNEFIDFSITNIGEDMLDSIEYRIYEDDILSSLDKVKLMQNEKEEFSIPATGATYRLKTAQNQFHPFQSIPQVVVELCGEEPYSLGFVTSQANSDLEHFIDIDCQEIIGSFDPNDKSVHPTGITNQHYIAEGTELTYKVRFQNTGNDTAFRVSIIDTLQSEYLNLQTFKITNTSHPYEAHINDQNVLIVEFDNILLPDSTTNEPESHGFVQYKITSFQDALQNSIVTNLANIYFDYNQPITTNTVFNTIGIPQLESNQNMALLQFDAYLDEQENVQLTWITTSEITNSYFEILRSSDGQNFESIGEIEAQSTANSPNFYQFEDNDIAADAFVYHYRLKQTDFNGQFIYSHLISIYFDAVDIDYPNQLATKIWYNAVQNNIEVIAAEALQLQIFDSAGRLVQNVGIIEGRQTIGTEDLTNGIYAYQLLQNGSLGSGQTGKLIIVGN